MKKKQQPYNREENVGHVVMQVQGYYSDNFKHKTILLYFFSGGGVEVEIIKEHP